MYVIHYTRNRRFRFDTLDEAKAAAEHVFQRTGVIVGIVEEA